MLRNDRETVVAEGTSERREYPRIPLNARIRVRAAGSGGPGHLCRVHDSSARGVRLTVDGCLDADWEVLEVLTESGRHYDGGLEVRVVWADAHGDGGQHVGCEFEQ